MANYNCPSCGAEIRFQSSVSVSCVCPYCRSLVVRRDRDIEAIGKMAELPEDISPLQIGTSGKFKDITFTLIGRMKIGWKDGCWNEWFFFSDDGRKGWLAEAQGSLAISFEQGEQDAPSQSLTLGDVVELQNIAFTVADIKEAECLGSEGELPFVAPKGRKTKAIDLSARNGAFASIEYCPPDPVRIYVGEYVAFNDLKLSYLRELPGWDAKRPVTQPRKEKKANDSW